MAALRTSVRDWLKKAKGALDLFSRDDLVGTFQLDSEQKPSKLFHTTTTARAYAAMTAMDWRASDADHKESLIKIQSAFHKLKPYDLKGKAGEREIFMAERFFESGSDENRKLNNFDIVHLADYYFALDYTNKFYPAKRITFALTDKFDRNAITKELVDHIRRTFHGKQIFKGQIRLDPLAAATASIALNAKFRITCCSCTWSACTGNAVVACTVSSAMPRLTASGSRTRIAALIASLRLNVCSSISPR
ncbi:MAG TPA: hypothetical protein VK749_01475, partial [Xanthobacteraceae bacterium]|nr:hypothetical protein [Xanthobacteraceae bacterium]